MASAGTEPVVRYRRWPYLVGGDSDGMPVQHHWWRELIVHAPKSQTIKFTYESLEESIDLESYVQRRITLGQTRLVLRVWMLEGLTEAQGMEMIWDKLLENVGA